MTTDDTTGVVARTEAALAATTPGRWQAFGESPWATLVPELLAEVELLSKLNEAMAHQLELWMKGHPMTGPRQSDVAALILSSRAANERLRDGGAA